MLGRYGVVLRLAEEDFECSLEDPNNFNPDCEHDHRHDERPERALPLSPCFAFITLLDLGDLNEELFQMERVQR